MEVRWSCPKCNAENVDDPEFTAVPLCAGCQSDIEWQDIQAIRQVREAGSEVPSLEEG